MLSEKYVNVIVIELDVCSLKALHHFLGLPRFCIQLSFRTFNVRGGKTQEQ